MNFDYGSVAFRGTRGIRRKDADDQRSDLAEIRVWESSIRSMIGRALLRGFMVVLVTASPLFPAHPDLSIDQYLHTSWTQEEGSALPPIQALAQTADGYLWLGTGTGLIRFDGMRFTEWSPSSGPALPSTDIRCLRPASGGGLWIGTLVGLCRMDHGRVLRFPSVDKLPCLVIASMLEDPNRGLWILNECSTANTLALVSPNGSIRTFGRRDGLPDQKIGTLFQDRGGTLWIGTSKTVCRWSPGSRAVCSGGPSIDAVSLTEGDSGTVIVADEVGKREVRFSGGQIETIGPSVRESSFTPGAMVRDHEGNAWIGTSGQGLLRLQQNAVDRFTRKAGLSSNLITGLLEDHEGDLWVATARGIDRIREPKVLHVSTLDGLSGDVIDAVLGTRDGSIWIGTADSGLNRLNRGRVAHYSAAAGLPSGTVISLYEDAMRRLWVGTSAGLAVNSGERFVEVLTAKGGHLDRVFNVTGDDTGVVWLADSRRGLFTVRGQVAYSVALEQGVDGRDIYRLLATRNGSVWLGHYHGGITVLNKGSAKRYDVQDGLAKGPIGALYEDREGAVWVGTGDGLSRFRDSRWATWTTAQGLPDGGVQSIVEDESGGLWLMTPAGVLRLARPSLNGAVKTLPYILYGRTEGLRLLHNGAMATPRFTRARDGQLWLCTEDGVAVIDPARVRSNPVPPPVVIEQVMMDGKLLDTPSNSDLTLRGHELQISYTGISLMVPEKVRFRYRMYGLDRDWTEAGTRRNVTYVNLPPGHYRFRVIACNNDGVWNAQGAELALRVNPYFYQTTWFALVCLSAALLLVWSVHQLRVRRLVSRFHLIAAERARFSRALHDSLLQGFTGVVYQLEAAVRQFEAAPDVSKQRLERALNQADESLLEARELIVSMRIPALENSTLPDALAATIAQAVSGLSVDFQLEVKGRVRQGPYDLEANIFLIAREAVTNSLNHAAAKRIRLELNYAEKELLLTVQDNGIGFDPELALAKAGHWGFRGVRERARQIGGTFAVESAPGRGSKITVAAPWKT